MANPVLRNDENNKKNQGQNNIKSNDELLRTITSSLGEGIYVLDDELRLTFMNPEAERLLGWKEAELLGKKVHKYIHYKKSDGTILLTKNCPINNIINTGKIYHSDDEYFTHHNKNNFPVSLVATPIMENNKVIGVVTAFQNISERKMIDGELRNSEDRYRRLIDLLPDAVFVVLNNKIVFLNPATVKLFGANNEKQLIGKNIFDLIHPDYHKIVKKRASETKKHNTKEPLLEEKYLTLKGKPVDVEVSAVPFEFNKKKAIQVVATNITQRKKAINALRKSEDLYRTLAEAAQDLIFVIGKDDTIEYVNSNAATFLGSTPDKIIGKKREQLFPEESDTQKTSLEEVLKKGKPIYKENQMIHDNDFTWQGTWLAPIIENGKTLSVMGVSRDITDQKIAELELKDAYEAQYHIAQTLQKSLLPPKMPKISDLEIKFFYQSASDGAEVGGDFYDVFRLSSGAHGIVVGDVSGKGIDAAAETAKVKYLLRDRAYYDSSPNNVLSKVNNAIFKQAIDQHFTALTYCIYDSFSSVLKISNAGNPYPYCLSKNKFIQLSGVPLSIMPKQSYPSTDIRLKKGEIILIFTDGLTEARINNSLFGSTRVKNYMKNNSHNKSLNQIIKGLVREARNFSNNHLRDDILILAMRKK